MVLVLFDHILKVAGSSAETYWLTSNRGLQLDVDKDSQLSAEDAADLADEIEEYQNQQRRVLRTRGVKITDLGSSGVDPSGVFNVLIALTSSATGIPRRILTGSEAAHLSSEQDRANWADYIESRRRSFAWPNVLKPLITKLSDAGVFVAPSKEVNVDWPSPYTLTPLEEGQMMAQKGRALSNITRQIQHGFLQTHQGEAVLDLEEGREMIGLPPEVTGTLPKVPEESPTGGGGDPNDEAPDEDGTDMETETNPDTSGSTSGGAGQ